MLCGLFSTSVLLIFVSLFLIRGHRALVAPRECLGPQEHPLRTSYLDQLGLLGEMGRMERRGNLESL